MSTPPNESGRLAAGPELKMPRPIDCSIARAAAAAFSASSVRRSACSPVLGRGSPRRLAESGDLPRRRCCGVTYRGGRLGRFPEIRAQRGHLVGHLAVELREWAESCRRPAAATQGPRSMRPGDDRPSRKRVDPGQQPLIAKFRTGPITSTKPEGHSQLAERAGADR